MPEAISEKAFYYGNYNKRPVERCSTLYFERVLSYLRRRSWRGCKSLDVGCDDGIFSVELQKLGFDTYGIDLRSFIVKEARKHGVKAIVADVKKPLPYKDNAFDLVFAGEIIEHLFDTDFFLHELSRVVKYGGLVIITTPNLASLQNRLRLLFGKLPGIDLGLGPGSVGHIRYYTFPALRQQMRKHGLVVVSEITNNFPFPMVVPWVPGFLKRMAIALGALFPYLGYQLIAVAVKRKP